jgi:tetratricopeptide (TPR) repeat protein
MATDCLEFVPSLAERCAAGVGYHRAGHREEAERLYRENLGIDPEHADSLHLLGVLSTEVGRYEEAVALIRRALQSNPDYPVAYHNLANALLELDRVEEAVAAYRSALELAPARAATHYNLANAYARAGLVEEALGAYRRALELRPDHSSTWNNFGNTLQRAGRHEEAIVAYRHALELEPEDASAANNLGTALRDVGRLDEALELFDRAVSLRKPGFEDSLVNKGLLLLEMGESAGARHAATEALAANPRLVAAWHLRASLKRFSPEDEDLGRLHDLLAEADTQRLSVEDRMRLQFTLGKAWMDAGGLGRAFGHLSEGNRLKRGTFHYDGPLAAERMGSIATTFTRELLRTLAGAGHPSEAPVFVVGMPRSGTSLVEQILASHPEVHGAGELQLLRELVPGVSSHEPEPCPPLYPPLLARLDIGELARLGREYADRVGGIGAGKTRVVDKMPLNFLYVGFIHAILPKARIIHCRRNALDTCLSCYIRPFCGDVAFAYDLRELGNYYRHYEELMAHWHALMPPERYTELHYEDVVADLEREARRLVEFCGLPWNDACLKYHQTSRSVRTASASEVRQPIYRTSVGRGKSCAAYLEPLLAALGN